MVTVFISITRMLDWQSYFFVTVTNRFQRCWQLLWSFISVKEILYGVQAFRNIFKEYIKNIYIFATLWKHALLQNTVCTAMCDSQAGS